MADSAVDKVFIAELIRRAHAANPPEHSDECGNVVLPSTDGWRVEFFYDVGELDYIDSFIAPDGARIEVWGANQDPRLKDGDDEGPWDTIKNWRGVEDTDRLLAYLHERTA